VGVHLVAGDPSRPQTLIPILDGIKAVFISPRALGDASAGPATAELLALARERGAQRVTLLSAVTVEYGGGHERFADTFKAVEDAAKASSLPWTILRCTDFAANSLALGSANPRRRRGARRIWRRGNIDYPRTRCRCRQRTGAIGFRARWPLLYSQWLAVAYAARQGPNNR
jgi:uncharacterized protein YbjT (DUF2867 family)